MAHVVCRVRLRPTRDGPTNEGITPRLVGYHTSQNTRVRVSW